MTWCKTIFYNTLHKFINYLWWNYFYLYLLINKDCSERIQNRIGDSENRIVIKKYHNRVQINKKV